MRVRENGMIPKVLRLCLGFFYDPAYLRGRFFETSRGGYVWALKGIITQRIFGLNRKARFPVSPLVSISNPTNIEFHPDNLDNFQTPGIYFQNRDAKITLGRGTYIANNVGLITQNHDPANPDDHLPGKPIVLGKKCWIGMNAVILPGVVLGDHTVVGAGSIVTKSFAQGYVVVAGNPARIVKSIDPAT